MQKSCVSSGKNPESMDGESENWHANVSHRMQPPKNVKKNF